MAYTSNPYAGKARRLAVNDVIYRRLSLAQAGRKYGVTRSAVLKWMRKAHPDHRVFIDTIPSRPKHHPRQLSTTIVERILAIRKERKRCAPVVHAQLQQEGIVVSLSSVERVLRRYHLTRKRKNAPHVRPLPRPLGDTLGSLVEMDTIHFVKADKSRCYLYTVIDTYTRLAYAEYHSQLSQNISLAVVLAAQKQFGFSFTMIQTDHGGEFAKGFAFGLQHHHIALRHSRIRKPNDNAHIERFNRTIQEECFDGYIPKEKTVVKQLKDYLKYYNYQRLHLGLNLQTPMQFVSKLLT